MDLCRHYQLIDSRVRDSNNLKFLKVNYIKYMAPVTNKMKHLERVVRKNLTLKILEEREVGAHRLLIVCIQLRMIFVLAELILPIHSILDRFD